MFQDDNKNGKDDAGEPWAFRGRGNLTKADGTVVTSFDKTNGIDGVIMGPLDDGEYCLNVDHNSPNDWKIGPLGTTGTVDDNKIDPNTNKYCFKISEETPLNSDGQLVIKAGIVPFVRNSLILYGFEDKDKNGKQDVGGPYSAYGQGNLTLADGTLARLS
ncbi:hypothetical protein SAMD00019534_123190 [Acytostelium subglobosum LB1]|uniref:hypothetical protein n=1 Tax=Acytostelium subglobosum LB1 TaxID=1410327 RepID=UPI000644ED90|nr:hypothetical protein SAMD00019534_123190 [Acytostelium subglobosum LB1]GAM29143.1 hypothetical protein SAMD00019534_123190 [Acytostelium subglobosum LB1]|eukprot:XP_012747834.1 hypothetical protein SAMD00019534_123190 [Acytostelium subglobosum LB1]